VKGIRKGTRRRRRRRGKDGNRSDQNKVGMRSQKKYKQIVAFLHK